MSDAYFSNQQKKNKIKLKKVQNRINRGPRKDVAEIKLSAVSFKITLEF